MDQRRSYDTDNVFAKIIRGEIPATKIYEDDHVLAFTNINPQAKVHTLIVPKGEYTDLHDFSVHASDAELVAYMRACGVVAEESGIVESGCRFISNCGPDSGQEIPHFHTHLVGGEKLGALIGD